MGAQRLPAEGFFLATARGARFCLYHAPQPGCGARGALVYVHPYGDEMNRARRMAALQARALSDAGWGVLAIDLYGCGDSSGESGDAGWDDWCEDLRQAHAWLRARQAGPIGVLGLRLGAALALDVAHSGTDFDGPVVLWQPVLNGKNFLTQVLRQRAAGDLFAEGRKSAGAQALRAALQAGETVEIAGYDISAALAGALDRLDLRALPRPGRPLVWVEIGSSPEQALAPASAAMLAHWRQRGVPVSHHVVAGPPFWASQETVDCPPLLALTTALFNGEGVAA